MFYVLVIAPMDQVFIGPLDSQEMAQAHADLVKAKHGHECHVMARADMEANQAEFGAIPIQPPFETMANGEIMPSGTVGTTIINDGRPT